MIKKSKIFVALCLALVLIFVNSNSLFAKKPIDKMAMGNSAVNVQEQRNIMTATGLNQYEQNVAMLRESGISEDIFARLDENEINQILANALSIDTQVYYLKSNENGNVEIVSEIECLEAVAEQEASLASNSDTNQEIFDAYMRITLTYVYLDPESQEGEMGWYMLYTWYDWMTIPKKRLLDAFSIASDDFDWETSSQHYSELGYNATDINNRSYFFEVQDADGFYMQDNGYYYTWDLPEDNKSDSYVFTSCYLYSHVKCRIKYPAISRNITMYIKYIHVHPLLGSLDNSDYIWTNSDFKGVKLNKSTMLKTQYESQVNCYYNTSSTN